MKWICLRGKENGQLTNNFGRGFNSSPNDGAGHNAAPGSAQV